MVEEYLKSSRSLYQYYKQLGESTFDQLSNEQLFIKSGEQTNSIAIMVNHLWGNMMSRWTNFLTSDGEKESRKRDAEFQDEIKTRDEMMKKWNEGWDCIFTALNTINSSNFDQTVYIRNQGHAIHEAINRQLAHYAYHVGQIVFLGKELVQDDWKSLSIAKGKSKEYNAQKFKEAKHKAHFTDEYLKKKT